MSVRVNVSSPARVERRMPSPPDARARTRRRSVTGWLFVAPSLALNLVIVLVPAVATVVLSFTSWNGLSSPRFTGLDNYRMLLSDPEFHTAIVNNLKWLCAYLVVPITLGFSTALFMSSLRRGGAVLRTLLFLPYVLPTVVTAQLWSLLLSPVNGANTLLADVGIHAPVWLGDPSLTLWSVVAVDIWRFWGLVLVIMIGSMGKVDTQLVEAAMIDGAGRFAVVRKIIIPQLRSTLALIVMLCLLWSFTAFDYVFVMTQGGPGYASQILATYMYSIAFQYNELGYAATLAVCLMVIALLVTIIYRFLRRGESQ
jgi:raffinose/stachyose/melibiose transport system permease protein